MSRTVILALSLFALLATQAVTESITDRIDRFKLFSNCTPIALLVERLNSDARSIGLTENALQTTVESRLRSARVYSPGSSAISPYLYVNVNVVGPAFHISLSYHKLVQDSYTDIFDHAITWNTGSTGTHGNDDVYILSGVSQLMDQFLVAFLRVNEHACE